MFAVLRGIFLIGDVLFLNFSIAIAFALVKSSVLADEIYLVTFSNLTWLFLIVVASPYSFSRKWDGPATLKNQIIFIFIHLLVVVSLIFFYDKVYSAFLILSVYLIFVPIFYGWKMLVLFLVRWAAIKEKDTKNVLLVCSSDLTSEAKHYLFEHSEWRYNFIEVVKLSNGDLPMEEIELACANNEVDEILICHRKKTDIKDLINFGLNRLIPIKLIADLRGENSADEKHFNPNQFINVETIPLDSPINQIIKRLFDFCFSLLFIILFMPWLLPFVSLLIKVGSKGPIFFRQRRHGKNNEPFLCLKFRTMVVNKDSDFKQATANDSRITRVGKILRKTSIDELPQFFNVLFGDMSIIGPRPHPIKLNEEFSDRIDKLVSRHYVKPGITGLAQAMGYRGETSTLNDMKNRITLDRFYIENWSFALDLKIIYLTVISLLKGSEKAY